MKIDEAGNLLEKKNFHMMSVDERAVERNLFRRVLDKKLKKKIKYTTAEQIRANISDLVAYGRYNGGSCDLCGAGTYFQPAIGFVIPNLKRDNNTIILCHDCLEGSYRLSLALKVNSAKRIIKE